jgi:hypothetical protein
MKEVSDAVEKKSQRGIAQDTVRKWWFEAQSTCVHYLWLFHPWQRFNTSSPREWYKETQASNWCGILWEVLQNEIG